MALTERYLCDKSALVRVDRAEVRERLEPLLVVGRAQKTIFVCRYLRDRDLQREINEGLNLVEAWNRVNTVIFYGKSGELASNRRDQQQLGMLALRLGA